MAKTFNIGDCVSAKNNITCDGGKISSIMESRDTKKGLLYKVNHNWYYADELTLLEVEKTQEPYMFIFVKGELYPLY